MMWIDNAEVITLEYKQEQQAKAERDAFKSVRANNVAQIKVTTTAGNTFDGDETSQTRMARAIVGLEAGETITWVLADNTVIQATKEELTEAMKLAGRAQADLWVQQP